MLFVSISFGVAPLNFEVSVNLFMVLQLIGGMLMNINYGQVKARLRDDDTGRTINDIVFSGENMR